MAALPLFRGRIYITFFFSLDLQERLVECFYRIRGTSRQFRERVRENKRKSSHCASLGNF